MLFLLDPRILGDHDLRPPPLIDHDMRAPAMMAGDKDMRHPMGDQDFRPMNMPPENRAFNDPRYRNVAPDGVPNRAAPFDRSRSGPAMDGRPEFDARGMNMSPRMEDPRSGNIPPMRMAPVSDPI